MILYAVTIFLSAFLLFQVQPLIAKIILPWFGGSAAVWSAAMLFFQLAAAGRLRIRAPVDPISAREIADAGPRRAAAGQLRAAADPAIAFVEADRSRRSDAAHSGAAGRDHRTALFLAFVHQPAAASLVRAAIRQRHAVPAIRVVEFRIDAGAAQFSVRRRAAAHIAPAGLHVERGCTWCSRRCADIRLGSARRRSPIPAATSPSMPVESAIETAPAERPSFAQMALWVAWPRALPRCWFR